MYIHSFLTSALVGCEWSLSRPHSFIPGKEPPVSTEYEARRATEPVWTIWGSENSLPYCGSNSDPSGVQFVAIRYTNCATVVVE
jgi:hypothetical protein